MKMKRKIAESRRPEVRWRWAHAPAPESGRPGHSHRLTTRAPDDFKRLGDPDVAAPGDARAPYASGLAALSSRARFNLEPAHVLALFGRE
jgi:hypothetical protein